MNKFTGTILTIPKMSGNVGAKTINIGGKGDDGATFIPSVSDSGIISWTNDKDLPNPEPVNIKGKDGKDGVDGYTPQKNVDYFDGKDGADGKTAYQYAKDGGYTGSESDFAMKLAKECPTKLSELTNDKGYITSGEAPVQSVNGKTGAVTLDAAAVGARADTWMPSATDVGALTKSDLGGAVNEALAQAKASGEFDGPQGQKGDPGEKGDKGDTGLAGYTPVKGTDYYTEADKAEMVKDVKASMDGIPSYWQTALDEGVESINTALCEAGRNKSAFLFYSDAHWNQNSQMSPKLLKHLYKNTGMTKTFFGGDIVANESTDYEGMKYLWERRTQLKDLPNHHSVVGNHDDGNATNNLFSEQYVYGYVIAPEETPDMVIGNGFYYYVDNIAEKTRYLCLDTAYKGVGSEQKAFITDALKSTPDNWHVVVVAHIWYQPDYSQYSVKPIPIIGLDGNATTVCTILDNYNSRSGEFADCGAKVEFCIGGHVHRDYIGTTGGGIPIILVETDSKQVRGEFTCTTGTATEASVNGIIADYGKNKVNVIRIGRGNSFIVDLESGESTETPDDGDTGETYTNQIPISTDTDGSIYNGTGYKVGCRINSSGVLKEGESKYALTGFIPFKYGDIAYISSDVFAGNPGSCVISAFNDQKTHLTNSSVYVNNSYGAIVTDENGNYIFDRTKNADGLSIWQNVAYIRVTGVSTMSDTSIITINEPIE